MESAGAQSGAPSGDSKPSFVPSSNEEGFGLHPFVSALPSFIDDQTKAHLARRASTSFHARRAAAIRERIALILATPDRSVPGFFLDLVATGKWDVLADIQARDGTVEVWEPPWEGQEEWEKKPDKDLSGGSFFKRTITSPTRLSRLFAIHNPSTLVVLFYVRLGSDLCGHPSILHGGMSAALMDELLGMVVWESFQIPCFTASLTVDYRKPVGLIDEWENGKSKELWGAGRVTEKKGRKTYARAELMDLPVGEGEPAEPTANGANATNGAPDEANPYGRDGVPAKCTVRVEAHGLFLDMKGVPSEHVSK
ncbi:HotDog domain-containing protein [Hyaloraphidium curvatum]|nr:HotDog domain-containing protein [Hyaloraphidium curvatum]